MARPMGRLALLSPDELEAARIRWERRAPGDACWRLHENVERLLVDPELAVPLSLPLTSNLFQAQGLLLEASLAFRLSGEQRYLDPVARCVSEVADAQLRGERLPGEVHPAFVVVGLCVAHELCGLALDTELLLTTVADIVGEMELASTHEPWGQREVKRHAWNHAAVAFAAIGCGGLVCTEHDPRAERWVESALERLRLFFAHGLTDAGMTREGLSYCGFVFRNVAPLLLGARGLGIWDYRNPRENPHLERLCRIPGWYAIETFPGGRWTQVLNDAYWSPRRAMGGFLPTFGSLDPGLAAWVYDHLLGERGDGTHGQDRGLSASTLFESVLWPPGEALSEAAAGVPELLADPSVGYFAERVRGGQRSSFSFNCGEFIGGIHDQSDNGSVTLFHGDVPVLIDSGASHETAEGSPSSTHGHSLVLIDGLGQIPAGQGDGCTGTIISCLRDSRATVISAELSRAYAARDYNPLAHGLRHCVYGKRPFTYLLVVDDFARPGAEPALFEQLFHTPPVAASVQAGQRLTARIDFAGSSAWMVLQPLDADAVLTQTSFLQHDRVLFAEHPVWRVRREGRGGLMPTLLLAHGGIAPELQVEVDVRAGRVSIDWRVGSVTGLDVLEVTPGEALAAVFTRDGVTLDGGDLMLGDGSSVRSIPVA